MTNQLLMHAKSLADNAIATSVELGHHIAVVCVDRAGYTITAQRQDLTPPQVVETARRKAATAAAMGTSTAAVAEIVNQDEVVGRALEGTPDMLAVPGGAPIVLNSVIAGGIGIAGGHYSEDSLILDKTLDSG